MKIRRNKGKSSEEKKIDEKVYSGSGFYTYQYVEMCIKLDELQKGHLAKNGDIYSLGEDLFVFYKRATGDYGLCNISKKVTESYYIVTVQNNLYGLSIDILGTPCRYFWVPREKQLREMIDPIIRASGLVGSSVTRLIIDSFNTFRAVNDVSLFSSYEEIFLAFAARLLYDKEWDFEKRRWVKNVED